MDEYIVDYKVEFLSPRAPREWPPEAFERAVDALLVEETLARKAEGSLDDAVMVAISAAVESEETGKLRYRYRLSHAVRFADSVPAAERPERLRGWLAEMLGVTPRQFEGPWNIVGISVAE